MAPLIVYIAGVRQHAGKTVTSLGLISVLRRHLPPDSIGYLKPVGQELDLLPDGVGVDKDVLVIRQFSHIADLDPKLVSPVRIGTDATKDYLRAPDREAVTRRYERAILDAADRLRHKRVIIAEGTGHPGVGSIVGISNAAVCRLLNAKLLYLAGGGLGRTIDEMEVDLSYFQHHGCDMRGVLFNKVYAHKIPQMRELITEKFLSSRYACFQDGLRIFGFIPETSLLNKPSMRLVASMFERVERIGNIDDPAWRHPCDRVRVISLTYEYFNPARFIKPGDIVIMGAGADQRLHRILEFNEAQPPDKRIGGIVLTCDSSAPTPEPNRRRLESSGIPAILVDADTSQADLILMHCFESAKIQTYDDEKYQRVEEIFAEHFDTKAFLAAFSLSP